MKVKNKNKNERRKMMLESDSCKKNLPICPNCGRKGHHYAPPSLGEEGFFICNSNPFMPKNNPFVRNK